MKGVHWLLEGVENVAGDANSHLISSRRCSDCRILARACFELHFNEVIELVSLVQSCKPIRPCRERKSSVFVGQRIRAWRPTKITRLASTARQCLGKQTFEDTEQSLTSILSPSSYSLPGSLKHTVIMGWFWQSSPSSNPTPTTANPTTPSQPPASTTPPSRDDGADSEMAKFLEMIQTEMQSSKPAEASSPNTLSSPTKDDPKQQQSEPQAAGRTAASRAISESLLQSEMSCKDAFDYAWHCHTPGSQWNAVYRYGSVRSCSELWEDFWFCMRTKGYKGELKAALTRAHYRAKEAAKYGPGKPSSEDVWESRDEKVAPGTAFTEKVDGPEENDREWQVREIERRRAVREGMGFKRDDGQAGR